MRECDTWWIQVSHMPELFIVRAGVVDRSYRFPDFRCCAGGGGTERSVGAERSIPLSHSMNAFFSMIWFGSRSASSSASFNISGNLFCSPTHNDELCINPLPGFDP